MKRRTSLGKWKSAAYESLLNERASLPENLFTIVTTYVGVVAPTNEAMSILSLLKV